MLRFPLYVLSAASAVSCVATPVHWAGFERQEPGWPASIANFVHNTSWPSFAQKSQRWDAYKAPTFKLVFLPENEKALGDGVRPLLSPYHSATCIR